MAFSTTWDLEKYKSEFESEEHWQLRKKFMETHKNQFPEEKLVCLARVFCNIEFLGCRYPEKTMKLVSELSKGVADDYREKQKGKLKRTFVQASDAAGAKIKGRGATPPSKITEGPPSKIAKSSDVNPSAAGFQYSCFVHESLVKPSLQNEGDFPGFIIYEACKTNCPINILMQSASKSKNWKIISFEFPKEKNTSQNERYCEVLLNKKLVASAVGQTNKDAKFKAATAGLAKLRQTCYTIQEKLSFFTDGEVVSKEQVEQAKAPPVVLPQDNIGSRMMMKMGWAGAGLGKHQQGIQAPIEAAQTMRRAGFGHLSSPQFQSKFKNIFKDYIASGSTNDLVFAPDFSPDERKTLHKSTEALEKDKIETKEDVKSIDKGEGEDLFGFDSDSDVIFPITSDEEVEEVDTADPQTCEVCRQLDSITGEESDDDLFDRMWGTGSDTSGLVNILEDRRLSLQKSESINDQSVDIESEQWLDEQAPLSLNVKSQEELLLHSRVSSVVSNLNEILEKRAMGLKMSSVCFRPPFNPPASNAQPVPYQDYPKRPSWSRGNSKNKSRIRIFLPDGSFRRFHGPSLSKNKEIMNFFNNQLYAKLFITFEDLQTNKALAQLFNQPSEKPKWDSKGVIIHNPSNLRSEKLDSNEFIEIDTEADKTEQSKTSVRSNVGEIKNTGNQSFKSETNIQSHSTQDKEGDETNATRIEFDGTDNNVLMEPAETDKIESVESADTSETKLSEPDETDRKESSPSSDMEMICVNDFSNTQKNVQPVVINQQEAKFKRYRCPRVKFTLSDGSTVRINTKYLMYNDYMTRYTRREKGLINGLFKPDEYPPPEYSDSSSDESESDWLSKTNLFISEPEDCEIDKVHVLRKKWEQFIVKLSLSKRNPFAKKWRNFIDQSPIDDTRYLCQKWREFMASWNPGQAEAIPASVLQPGHNPVPISHVRQTYIPPLHSSRIDPNLITVYGSNCGKLKISKDLILNNMSWTGRGKSLTTKFTQFRQSLESIKTTKVGQLDQNSGNENSPGLKDITSNTPKTSTSKLEETKTISDSLADDEHNECSERNEENEGCEVSFSSETNQGKAKTIGESLVDDEHNECSGKNVQNEGGEVTSSFKTNQGSTKTIGESLVDDEHKKCSDEDEEKTDGEVSLSCKKDKGSTTVQKRYPSSWRYRARRIRLTLPDGSRIRIRKNNLIGNKYFSLHNKRQESIMSGVISPDEIPPPYYSDSSTDDDESDWITNPGILITEPENCDIDKSHILRKNWEQFILTVGSSKRNPIAKKWRQFLSDSPVGERKTLCQKWLEFQTMNCPLQGTHIPACALEEAHKPVTSFSQPVLAPTLPGDEALLRHLQESTILSSQTDLEKHINASDLTVVHSSVNESPISSCQEQPRINLSIRQAIKSRKAKSKKIKKPYLTCAFLSDGSKVKINFSVLPQNWKR